MATFGHLVYDSGNEGNSGRRRIGTSATEIELFDDVPPSSGSTTARSTNFFPTRPQAIDRQRSPSTSRTAFQPLSPSRREEPRPNVIYQDANDQQLGSAVDRLLEKYAPEYEWSVVVKERLLKFLVFVIVVPLHIIYSIRVQAVDRSVRTPHGKKRPSRPFKHPDHLHPQHRTITQRLFDQLLDKCHKFRHK